MTWHPNSSDSPPIQPESTFLDWFWADGYKQVVFLQLLMIHVYMINGATDFLKKIQCLLK
jgi:hypothetical protein